MPTCSMGFTLSELAPNHFQNPIFSCAFALSRRPILGVALKWNGPKKQQCAGISASLGDSVVDEKVFQFKPSFDEYLKAMESVKSSREKQLSLGSSEKTRGENGSLGDSRRERSCELVREEGRDDSSLRSTKRGGYGNLRDSGSKSSSEVVTKEGRDDGGLRSKRHGENGKLRDSGGKSWNWVVMKGGRDYGGLRSRKHGENGKLRDSGGKGSSGVMMKRWRDDGGLRSQKPGGVGKLRDFEGKSSSGVVMKVGRDYGGLRSKRDGRNEGLRDSEGKISSGVVMKTEGENGGLRSKRDGKIEGLKDSEGRISRGVVMKAEGENGGLKSKRDGRDDELKDSEAAVSRGVVIKGGKDDGFRLVIEGNKMVMDKKNVEQEKQRELTKKSVIDEGIDEINDSDMERDAFKPLKELEVYAKPRITMADMEERIQKLAKCLNGADIDMPEWMFTKMMRNTQIKFSDHSMQRLIQILGKLGNWRRVLQVIEWIQLRERFKSHKLKYIHTTALNVLQKSRRPVEALNLFNLMQQDMSSYPDIVAYRCIAVTLGQAGHMKELFHVMDSMRTPPKKKLKTGVLDKWDPRLEPDIVVYNAVLNACVWHKNWEGAFWVLQQLKQQDQKPSNTTYGLVMEVMLACGKYNLVHEFFRKVQKTCIPNALTYKVLVNALWREGKIEEAMLAVEDMERRGIVGTASLYYDLARGLCSSDRCQEALLQIDKLCKVANKPLVVTYTGLIQACIDSGNAKNAAYIFNHMQSFCAPNLVTYNILLKALLDDGMFEEAKELFLRILGDQKVMPDRYTFNAMLDACAAGQKWDDFEFVYITMLKYGHHFNAKRHLQIVLNAFTAGKEELLEITWKHLARGDKVPHFLLIDAMFRLKLEQGDLTAALSCFGCHPSIESRAFSMNWWLRFFKENHYLFGKHGLVKLLHTADLVVTRTDGQELILQNLRMSCKEFLSMQKNFEKLESLETTSRTAL